MYLCRRKTCDSGSVGRALASQAEGRGFESRLSLQASHEHKLASPHNIFPTAFQGNPKKSVTFAVGFADMAQLVEQRIRNAWVGGSSPPIGSRQEKRGTFLSFFVCHAEHCKNLARKSILGYFAIYPRINGQVSNDTLQSNLACVFSCHITVYSFLRQLGTNFSFRQSQLVFLFHIQPWLLPSHLQR